MTRLTFLAIVAPVALHAMSSGCQEPNRDTSALGSAHVLVKGIVQDTSGRSLEGAEVRIDSATFALSSNRGEFTLAIGSQTDLRLHVRRLGYLAKDTLILASAVRDHRSLAIALTPNAVQLGTIIVAGRALDTRLWDAGYYHRRRLGTGRFVGPEELEHFASGLAAILRETPRVQMDRQNNQEFAYARVGGHRCRMNVFVDGTYARFASPGVSGTGPHDRPDPGVGLDGVVPREDIRAVEIYPSLVSVPSQFVRIGPASNQASTGRAGRLSGATTAGRPSPPQREEEGPSDAACGAIVIWTKWYASRRQPASNPP